MDDLKKIKAIVLVSNQKLEYQFSCYDFDIHNSCHRFYNEEGAIVYIFPAQHTIVSIL